MEVARTQPVSVRPTESSRIKPVLCLYGIDRQMRADRLG